MKILVDKECPPDKIYFLPKASLIGENYVVVPTEGDKQKLEKVPETIKEIFEAIEIAGGGE